MIIDIDGGFETNYSFSLIIKVSVYLKEVKKEWFKARHLKYLYFANVQPFLKPNAWEIFAQGVSNWSHLLTLSLINCEIDDIPDEIFAVLPSSIVTLSLAGNRLTRLSSCISKLTKLESLNLSNNVELCTLPWSDIPDTVTNLNLENTNVLEIPAEISRFSLQELVVSSQQLTVSLTYYKI